MIKIREVPTILCNGDMRVGEIRCFCRLPDEGGNDATQSIGAGLSSHPEAGTYVGLLAGENDMVLLAKSSIGRDIDGITTHPKRLTKPFSAL